VPGPNVDLLALLRPTEVSVTVAGHPFVLQAHTAAQWIGAIATDAKGLYGIVPGLIADDDLDLMERLWHSHDDINDRWFHAARTALGRAGGRDWWWTYNLCLKALGTWPYLNGILLRQGIDSHRIGLPDWLDACFTLLWQGADEDNRTKLELELSRRPAGLPLAQSRTQVASMMAQFSAD